MKPIYIEMKAFGSYRDEKIDFTGKSQGLFLITGDTGAGKTTIFDAICYALYGETSGGKRSGEMMCSQFAKPGEKTEVRFCFDYDGRKYLVTRSPDQPKWNKKGERLKTTTGTKVSLILPDGTEFAGKPRKQTKKYSRSLDWGVISSHRSQCLRRATLLSFCMRHRKSAKKFLRGFLYIDL